MEKALNKVHHAKQSVSLIINELRTNPKCADAWKAVGGLLYGASKDLKEARTILFEEIENKGAEQDEKGEKEASKGASIENGKGDH